MFDGRSLTGTLALIVLFVVSNCNTWGQSKQKKREAAYEAVLHSYTEVIKPGMTRKELEDYLHAKGTAFQQFCCNDEKSVFSDLVRIGKEKHPWYCSEHNVYIEFQFAMVEPHFPIRIRDSDTLTKITIFHHLEGCL